MNIQIFLNIITWKLGKNLSYPLNVIISIPFEIFDIFLRIICIVNFTSPNFL